MTKTEAKMWLAGRPTAREAHRYNATNDVLVTRYVPRLCGHDVQVIGQQADFGTHGAALAAAQYFQDCIRQNHQDV